MEGYTHTSQVLIILLTLFLFISSMQQEVSASSSIKTSKAFIKKACNSTTYPQVCYQSLSTYASKIKTDPFKLCNTALTVTLKAARNTSSFVSKLLKQKGHTRMEAAIIKDCVENIGDSIDELQQSLKALGNLGGGYNSTNSKEEILMQNIKTWVSAAVTDEGTCMDGFDGSNVSANVKNQFRKSILSVAKLTSNALSIVNSLSYT